MPSLKPNCLALYFIATLSLPALAKDTDVVKTESESLGDTLMSCGELLEKVRTSKCGNRIVDIFRGGFIAMGISGNTLSAKITNNDRNASFNGDLFLTPYFSVNTRPTFIDDTDFGFDFSFGFERAHALKQVVNRDGDSRTTDLNSFSIANTISTEASIFYSYGAQDETPKQYFVFGVGFGLGYADVVGKAYLTQVDQITAEECYQAGVNLVNDQAGAALDVSQNCTLQSFRRLGIGFSGLIHADWRYQNFFVSIDSRLVTLSGGKSLSFGTSNIHINPTISAITLSYLYDL